jgi:putative glutamine amidotransferase
MTMNPEDGKDFVREDYAKAVVKAGGLPVALPPSGNPEGYFERLDGFLLPGGDDIDPSFYGEEPRFIKRIVPVERTGFEVRLARLAAEGGKPLLAICCGMQTANAALGGTLYQDIRAQAGGGVLDHEKGFHEVALEGPFGKGQYVVNSSHHQACRELAPALRCIARSADGIIEGFSLGGHPFFVGLQWHPERMAGDPLSERVFGLFVEACGRP